MGALSAELISGVPISCKLCLCWVVADEFQVYNDVCVYVFNFVITKMLNSGWEDGVHLLGLAIAEQPN